MRPTITKKHKYHILSYQNNCGGKLKLYPYVSLEIKQCSKSIEAVELLKSIPGVGNIIAPILAAEIGNIDRFSSASSLVAFCGVDPTVRQSGMFNGTKNKISKRVLAIL
ncbi:MAG: hypothetical protein CVV02_18095 [Firmicutes bacterium HGW-Firmicutes-7]|nr:MAG: hypothetical protein CVV02_18095 [Firmicutes bacterium HGW-Firmicutes-7]